MTNLSVCDTAANVQEVLAGDSLYGCWHEDALRFLQSLPENSLDLIVGSPPYAGKTKRYGPDGLVGKKLVGQDWVDWMVEIYTAAARACKGVVAMVVDGSTRKFAWDCTPCLLIADLHRKGFNNRKPGCYSRNGIPGSGGTDWWSNKWEFIICTTPPGKLPWSDKTACGHPPKYKRSGNFSNRKPNGQRNNRPYTPPEKANPGNIIHCLVGGGHMGSKKAHNNEAPFPELIPERFIRSFCRPGGIVCDPFSGSGTTLATALRFGRKFVGCDIREDQVALSIQRAKDELSRLSGQPLPPEPVILQSKPQSKPAAAKSAQAADEAKARRNINLYVETQGSLSDGFEQDELLDVV